MNEEIERIWTTALPYQDARDDIGHAKIVTEFAEQLCECTDANENVVVPAAILHDIGWSQIPKREVMKIFAARTPEEEGKLAYDLRIQHQEKGATLAQEILGKVNYPEKYTSEIVEIISQHDTRKGSLNLNDAIMRDADKLWQFTETGIEADLKRRPVSKKEYLERLSQQIQSPNFFFTQEAKELAKKELAKQTKKSEKN